MKNMSVIFLSLFALTFGLCGNATAAPLLTQKSAAAISSASTAKDVAEVVITCVNESTDECVDKTGSTAFQITVPDAVAIASAAGITGVTASTAIGSLSGAEAVSISCFPPRPNVTVGSVIVKAIGIIFGWPLF